MAKNVFISNNLPQGSVGLIPRSYSLDYNDSDAPLSKAELISRLKGKDGLICTSSARSTTRSWRRPDPQGRRERRGRLQQY